MHGHICMDEGTRDLVHYNPISDAILLPGEQIGRWLSPIGVGTNNSPDKTYGPSAASASEYSRTHSYANKSQGLVRRARKLQPWCLLNKKKVSERRYVLVYVVPCFKSMHEYMNGLVKLKYCKRFRGIQYFLHCNKI